MFSAVARGVYELAEARDLPGASELGYVARGQDYRRRRSAGYGDGHGGATFDWSELAEEVLDRVLPPLGIEYLGSLAGRRPRRPGSPRRRERRCGSQCSNVPVSRSMSRGCPGSLSCRQLTSGPGRGGRTPRLS